MDSTKKPIDKLEELLPFLKTKLHSGDYVMIKDISDGIQQENYQELVFKDYSNSLKNILNSDEKYSSNNEPRHLLETAISLVDQIIYSMQKK